MATISGTVPVGTVNVACSTCDTEIPVPVTARIVDAELAHKGKAVLECTPDMADLWAHMWSHDEC